MHPRLFFPLLSEFSEEIKKNHTPIDSNHKENDMPTLKKLEWLKKINRNGVRRTTGKRPSKLGGNRFQPFHSACHWLSKGIWILAFTLSSNVSFAAIASDGYAFTGALVNIMNELKGPPIAIITAIAIIAAGFMWVFKGHDVGLKQVIGALIGGGIVIAAPTLITMVPGMSGAVI